MANKRRAKKHQVPFRKYGPDGVVFTRISANEFKQKKVLEKNREEDCFYTYSYGDSLAIEISEEQEARAAKEAEKEAENDGNNVVYAPELPEEVLSRILYYIAQPTGISVKFMLVSKQFYRLCLPLLYNKPVLNSRNFSRFVDSITTATITSYLSYTAINSNDREGLNKRALKYAKTPFVKSLDLSNIVQVGRNSNITKTLRRCSLNLQSLIAPQTSFGMTSLNILKMCHNLKLLDLSLVSETVNLSDLFMSIKELANLTTLKFPRSSINCTITQSDFVWPINLETLRLSGGITNDFLMDLQFPETLTSLEFQHCPLVNDYAIYYLLAKIGLGLRHLSIAYPMPGLTENSLDLVFKYCPFLHSFETFVDYVSQWCFSEVNLPWIVNAKHIPTHKITSKDTALVRPPKRNYIVLPQDFDPSLQDTIICTTVNYFEETDDDEPIYDLPGLESLRPLKSLYIGSSGTLGQANKVHPDDLIIALGERRLPHLQSLQISNRVGWNNGDESFQQLVDVFGGNIYMCP